MPDPFFIVGNDRSGTTMLRLIVDRGADAAVPPESMFLTDFAAAFDAGGPRDAAAAAQLMHEVWEHPKVRLWELPPQPPAVPPGLTGQDAYRFIVAAPFEAYAARHGKPRWGDKTPHYVHHIDHLLRLWPRRALRRARARRARRRAVAAADAVRPEQRLGGGAVVGARRPGRRARAARAPRTRC